MATKEKFEEAKRLYETANADQRYVLESLFPELKESKDERIRKALIDTIKFWGPVMESPYMLGISKEDILTWLEKQGEKKPTDKVEQKFVWSEEDATHYNRILKELNLQKEMPINVSVIEEVKSDITWLKSIKDRVQPQPKQEWSKEDNKKFCRIYSILSQAADEHAFSTTCRLIGDKECIELQDFLKSLKPQNRWKPSDEQMKTLEESIIFLGSSCVSISQFVLNSLYNDLQKLKG